MVARHQCMPRWMGIRMISCANTSTLGRDKGDGGYILNHVRHKTQRFKPLVSQ